MTTFRVRHITSYATAARCGFGRHQVMFRPRDSYDQRLISAELAVDPGPSEVRWILDVFGNCVALVDIAGTARRSCASRPASVLDHTPQDELAARDRRRGADLSLRLSPRGGGRPRRRPSRPHYPDPEVDRWARRFLRAGRPTETGRLLMTLCFAIHESFVYSRRSRARHPAAAADAAAPPRHLPRFRAADDGGGPLPRLRGPLRLRLRLRPEPRRRRCDPRRRVDPCLVPGLSARAPAGWSSTRPTASSATAT